MTLYEALAQHLLVGSSHNGEIQIIDGKFPLRISYSDFAKKSFATAWYFKSKGLSKGSYAVIQTPSVLDFLFAFWGSILVGAIPVPVAYSNDSQKNEKLESILKTLGKGFVLGDTITYSHKNFHHININLPDICDYEISDVVSLSLPTEIAYIQFSSGSTNSPTGVCLTHADVLEHVKNFTKSTATTNSDKYLSWMPLSHDFGLVAMHIVPLVLGLDQSIINTNLFVARPTILLETAAREKSTFLSMTNFACEYVVTHAKRHDAAIDLRSIRVFFNGAEPINRKTMNDFSAFVERKGARQNAMTPAYGLAQATLVVCNIAPDVKPNWQSVDFMSYEIGKPVRFLHCNESISSTIDVVSVGQEIDGVNVSICDGFGKDLPSGFLGYIWIKGTSVAERIVTEKGLVEHLHDGWLNTGDIGFSHENHFYITGRDSDLIKYRGSHLFSNDLELMVSNLLGISLAKVVVVASHFNGEERLICFVKSTKTNDEFAKETEIIASVVREKIKIEFSHFVKVKKIPKTTSGKVQRQNLLINHLQSIQLGTSTDFVVSRKTTTLIEPISESCIEDFILSRSKNVDGNIAVSQFEYFEDLGITSLELVDLVTMIGEQFKVDIDAVDVFNYPSIREFTAYVYSKRKEMRRQA